MGFKFNKNIVVIEIEDNRFTVTADAKCIDTIKEIKQTAKDFATNEKLSGKKTELSEVITLYRQSIDKLLGIGSSDIIFADGDFTIADYIDVFSYITSEIKAYFNTRMNPYSSTDKGEQ